ncbi:MazG-like family protein [Halorarius halobius]|uniref:MazG-like family protein n=1 Tax=Halorarius halobius TaxID=2962671 RepID=UPI0020CF721F|nr:MazG-like family protein [Halorarius halobius]
MDRQERVATFVADHELDCHPAYRLLDLAAEVGELAADANRTTEYGVEPDALAVERDEVGDTLFAVLALADALDIDADAALEESLDKYESRIDSTGSAGSDA